MRNKIANRFQLNNCKTEEYWRWQVSLPKHTRGRLSRVVFQGSQTMSKDLHYLIYVV